MPSVQKKTGPVAKEIDDAVDDEAKPNIEESKPITTKLTSRSKNKKAAVKQQLKSEDARATDREDLIENPTKSTGKKRKSTTKVEIDSKDTSAKKQKTQAKRRGDGIESQANVDENGRRRSGRVSGKGL